MKKILFLAILLGGLSIAGLAQIKVIHGEEIIDFIITNPCTGEGVHMTGVVKDLTTFYFENNIVRSVAHNSVARVEAVGMTSGTQYRVNVHYHIINNGHLDPGTLVINDRYRLSLKPIGPGDEMIIYWNYKLVYNHNDRLVIYETPEETYCN